jgi:hypothetical protein
MFLAILSIAGLNQVDGAGECGKNTTPDMEAFKMAPCASAAQDENSSVSSQCCARVKKIGQNPACLCAVMLSNTAKSSGIKPEIAMTIPKRCNIADRPVGYKCGGSITYSLSFMSSLFLPAARKCLNLLVFSCSLYFTLKSEDHELCSPCKVLSINLLEFTSLLLVLLANKCSVTSRHLNNK